MMEYEERPATVQAVQLRWDNWSEMCMFADVGELSKGKPEGRMENGRIALDIPTEEGKITAHEGQYVLRDGYIGELRVMAPHDFEGAYRSTGDKRDANA